MESRNKIDADLVLFLAVNIYPFLTIWINWETQINPQTQARLIVWDALFFLLKFLFQYNHYRNTFID